MSITDIIVESFKLYKNNFKRFFVFMLLTFIPGGLIIISKFLLTYFFPITSFGAIGISFLVFLFVALIFSLIAFWFNITFIRVIAQTYTGTTIGTLGSELGSAKKVFWPAIGVTLLTALAVLGGMILLIIPGIIFMLWFAFSYVFVAVEHTGVMEGMHKSKALVDGRWWKVLLRIMIPGTIFGILAYVITSIIGTPLDYVVQHTDPLSTLFTIWSVVSDLILSFVTSIVTPLTTIALVVVYMDLKKTPVQLPSMNQETMSTPPSPPTA